MIAIEVLDTTSPKCVQAGDWKEAQKAMKRLATAVKKVAVLSLWLQVPVFQTEIDATGAIGTRVGKVRQLSSATTKEVLDCLERPEVYDASRKAGGRKFQHEAVGMTTSYPEMSDGFSDDVNGQ